MPDVPERPPPEVTIRGGPTPPPPGAGPRHRPALLPLLLGLAAVAVLLASARGRPAPTPEDCADGCPGRGTVVVGALLPLTGVLAPFGTAQLRGVEQVLDGVNAEGGVEVGGERRPVELVVRDTRSLPDVAGQQALILARGRFRLVALLGPCAPPVAVVRVAESRDVPLVTGCQPLPTVGTTPLSHTWEVAPADDERADGVFAALRAARDRRVALFLSNDRSDEAWTAAAARAGFTVVGTYRPQGQQWSSAVTQALASDARLVVALTQPPEGIGLWRELRSQGLVPELAYASEAGLGSAWWAAVGPQADGTLTDAVHPTATAPAGQGATAADAAVTAVSAELTRILVDGLGRAESADRADVNAALAAATGEVAGRTVRFSGGQVSRVPHQLARWEDGHLRAVGPSRR